MCTRSLALLLALGLLSATTSAGEMTPAFRVGRWIGHAAIAPPYCEAVIIDQRNRSSLSIAALRRDGKMSYAFALRSKAFQWRAGVAQPVVMSVDGRSIGS